MRIRRARVPCALRLVVRQRDESRDLLGVRLAGSREQSRIERTGSQRVGERVAAGLLWDADTTTPTRRGACAATQRNRRCPAPSGSTRLAALPLATVKGDGERHFLLGRFLEHDVAGEGKVLVLNGALSPCSGGRVLDNDLACKGVKAALRPIAMHCPPLTRKAMRTPR